jgi:hypothetical protein
VFATSETVEEMLQAKFTTDEQISAETHIRNATGRIRGWTGQHISPVTVGVVSVRDPNVVRLFLPHPPAIPVSVTTVVVDGVTLDAADFEVDRVHGLTRTDGSRWTGLVVVTYDHGFATVPDDVSAVCAELASRKMTNPTGSQSVKIEGFSESFSTTSEMSDSSFIASLRRYRLESVA